jgi:hypothetical protein
VTKETGTLGLFARDKLESKWNKLILNYLKNDADSFLENLEKITAIYFQNSLLLSETYLG